MCAVRLWPTRFAISGQGIPEVIDERVGEEAAIGYDHRLLRLVRVSFSNPILIQPQDIRQLFLAQTRLLPRNAPRRENVLVGGGGGSEGGEGFGRD